MRPSDHLPLLVVLCCFCLPMQAEEEPGETSGEPPPYIETPEETLRCIQTTRIRSTRILDARSILFVISNRQQLINRMDRDCPGLMFEKRFGYRTSTARLCRGDIIYVLTSIGRGASCVLSSFEPYLPDEGLAPGIDNDAIEVQGD